MEIDAHQGNSRKIIAVWHLAIDAHRISTAMR